MVSGHDLHSLRIFGFSDTDIRHDNLFLIGLGLPFVRSEALSSDQLLHSDMLPSLK